MAQDIPEHNQEQENPQSNPDAESSAHEGVNENEANQPTTEQPMSADGVDGVESNPKDTTETIESLKLALAAAELKIKDEALRAQAEMQNVRRRAERDVENAHKFSQEKLIKELLAVIDSLERGIQTIDDQGEAVDPAVKAIRDGSDLTLKMFVDVLAKFKVKQLDPAGEPFDPQFHEAITMVSNPDVEPNSVIAVVQKGYTLHERLVRPAMVVVSKA